MDYRNTIKRLAAALYGYRPRPATMESIPKTEDTALLIHIEHTRPIEIGNLVAAMNGINTLYTQFARKHADITQPGARLYVEKIENGCIDLYLLEMAAWVLPFAVGCNTLVEFCKHVAGIYRYFINGEGERPSLNAQEKKAASDVLSVTSDDRGSTTTINVVNRADGCAVYNGCTINYNNGNSAQNQIREFEEEEDEQQETVRNGVLMTVAQARDDDKKGCRACISDISKAEKALFFASEELRNGIIRGDGGPFGKAFYVDVALLHVAGRLTGYKVIALHGTIPLDE